MNWIEAISGLSEQDTSFVIVTILSVQGSAPRDAETKMVVSANTVYDTIGGGNLEYQAIHTARNLLEKGKPAIIRKHITLGKDLTQCCGGQVELLFECILARNFNVVVFGAGHVGRALIKILSELSCKVQWIDSRDDVLKTVASRNQGSNVELLSMDNPDMTIENCPHNAYYFVMTHSHELDMQIVEAILSRGDSRFCGLIGSKSKAAKFKNRLARKQFTEMEIEKLVSPVGLPQIKGKKPMEVAVSAVGQLIALHEQNILQQQLPEFV